LRLNLFARPKAMIPSSRKDRLRKSTVQLASLSIGLFTLYRNALSVRFLVRAARAYSVCRAVFSKLDRRKNHYAYPNRALSAQKSIPRLLHTSVNRPPHCAASPTAHSRSMHNSHTANCACFERVEAGDFEGTVRNEINRSCTAA
jgi:hypothetical protein